jgi:hypothetical protein
VRLFPLALAFQAIVWSQAPSGATTAQIKDIRIPKIDRKPALEEFLGGNSRPDMKRVDDFRQRQPHDGEPASYRTSAWLGYDDKNLYIVFACQSPPGEVRARLVKREDIFSEDWVAVILDTFHDRRRGYEFFVNPLGVQAEALEGENINEDFSFDTLWYSEGRLTKEGYVASFSLPFKSLRFSPADFQTWGLGLGRHIPPRNETSFWPAITFKIADFNQQLGNMTGLEKISSGRNLQFIPYGAFGRSHFLDNPSSGAPGYRTKTDFRGGLDAKAVLHDSLTLDVALNPDFSQVESDDPQVTVNQRYEVQFPEKRPFFLENSSYFATPENLLFSRRIVDPEFGARLSGKIGHWSIGLLGMDDRAPGAALGDADPHRGDRALIGVARVQRELPRQSNIGLLVTTREFAGGYNRVGSVDSRFKIDENWSATGQASTSETRTPEGERFVGNAFNLDLNGNSRNYNYDLNYIDRGERFHTDLGFIPRAGIRQLSQFAKRSFHPKSKVLLALGPRLSVRGDLDRRSVQQDLVVNPGFNLEMPRSTYLYADYTRAFERFGGINFRRHIVAGGAHTEYFKLATLDFNYSKGGGINYSAPAERGPFLADETDIQTSVTLRPLSRLKLDEIYYLTRLVTRPDSFPGAPARPATIFVNHLVRSRVNYQFNRRLSLRLILDYNGVLQNPSLVTLDRQKRVTGDVLLTYLLHPGTAFYIGYTDRLENLALFPGSPDRVARTAAPWTTTGRQLFMKMSYLLRF